VFVPRAATILHADLDAFYASVAQRDDPSLRGRPVAVGPGVVMAASYEARARGVRSAMSAGRARRLCPDLVIVECSFEAYSDASRAVFDVFADTSPIVEKLSVDEAFLDVRGLDRISGTPEQIAVRLRARVRKEVGLPLSVGVASSKLVAKVASNEAKPDGLLVVPAGGELDFLHPLGVRKLWGVGAATAERLNRAGIETVGDAAARSEDELVEILGRAGGRGVYAMALGRDRRRVRAGRSRRSFGAQSALGRRGRTADELDAVLVNLVDRVTRRMRAKGAAGRSVTLRLRFSDFARATRSHTLSRPTARMATVLAALRLLLAAAMPMIDKRGVTLLGVTISGLDGGEQLELPLDGHDPQVLDATVDDVRERFGTDAVTRAKLL
jgi:DNA polymerase IV